LNEEVSMFSIFRNTQTHTFWFLTVGAFLLVASASALAIDVEFIDDFQGSAADPFDYFGYSVGLDVDSFIVGAPGGKITFDDEDYSCGLAYIFEKSGSQWQQAALLYPHDYENPGKDFGFSVDIDDGFAVVSSPFETSSLIGSVYVFQRFFGRME